MFFYLPTSFQNSVDSEQKIEGLSTCDIDNVSFKGDEELVYKVYYNWGIMWLNAAEVVFKVKEKRDGYHITAVGKTYQVMNGYMK